jgi:hypothetical protein
MARKATKFFDGAQIGPWTLIKELEKKKGNRLYECKDKFGNVAKLWTSNLSLIKSDFDKENPFVYFEELIVAIAQYLKNEEPVYVKEGSLAYRLFGRKQSMQSLLIRFGNYYEAALNEFAILCGHSNHMLKNKLLKGKQLDSLFNNDIKGVLTYLEQKANAQLDSEKLPATANKILKVVENLKDETQKQVEGYLLWTSVFDIDDDGIALIRTQYRNYQNKGIEVWFMSDFFKFCGINVTRQQFDDMWLKVQDILNN